MPPQEYYPLPAKKRILSLIGIEIKNILNKIQIKNQKNSIPQKIQGHQTPSSESNKQLELSSNCCYLQTGPMTASSPRSVLLFYHGHLS